MPAWRGTKIPWQVKAAAPQASADARNWEGGYGATVLSAPRDQEARKRARTKLERIEHIVVLMLENRSFDHTLGYLALPQYKLEETGELPTDVNGLEPGVPTFSIEFNGHVYAPYELNEAIFANRNLDPPHGAEHVAMQLAGGEMNGFIAAFADSLEKKNRAVEAADPDVLQAVMGYLTPGHVPVYDHLARQFCVCDHWFCSIPGPTLPNRFFAVAGTTNEATDNKELITHEFGRLRSFFRHLDDTAWRWYSSDPAILRAVDEKYMFDDREDHFAYFDQYTDVQPRSFLRDVLGDPRDLPSVS
jgi:phospholipase C